MSGVEIRVTSNSQQARSDLKKVEQSIGGVKSATNGLAAGIKNALAVYTSFVSVKSIVSAGDTFKSLANQLKLVQQEGEPVAATMAKLNNLALASRTSLQTTAQNYSRLARSMSTSGKSSAEFLDITEAINKATKLGNAPLATQQAALFQLSQAFSSGVLRGEEFNSVSEGAPEILRALTESLGITKFELRELAFDGKITTDVLTGSLLKALPRIRQEFSLLTPLVSELSESLRSEFTRALAEIDNILGVSESVGNKIKALTTAFTFIADNAKIEFLKLSVIFYKFQYQAIVVFDDVRRSLSGVFTGDLKIQDFITKINSAISILKEFVGIGEQKQTDSIFENLTATFPKIDLTDAIVGMDSVIAKLTTFSTNVINLFKNIWTAVIGSSWWSDIFWKSETQIGGPKFDGALSYVLKELSSWKNSIVKVFKDIFLGSEQFGGSGQSLGRKGGFSTFFTTATENISAFVSSAEEAVKSSRTFTAISETLASLSTSFITFRDELLTDIDAEGGILGYLTTLLDTLGQVSSELTKNFTNSIDNTLFGGPPPSTRNPNDPPVASTPLVDKIVDWTKSAGNFGKAVITWLEENPWTTVGIVAAAAMVLALPAELQFALAQGAFLGIGIILGNALAAALTAPITITVGILYFSDTILESLNEKEIPYRLGKFISDGMVNFFKEDAAGGDSTFKRILSALFEATGGLGKGLIEGFLGEDVDFGPLGDKIAGSIALVFATASFITIIKNGILGTTRLIAGWLFGLRFRVWAWEGLKSRLAWILLELQTNPGLIGRAFSVGTAIGTAILKGFAAGLIAYQLKDPLENLIRNLEDTVIAKFTGRTRAQVDRSQAEDLLALSRKDGQEAAVRIGKGVYGSEDFAQMTSAEFDELIRNIQVGADSWLDAVGATVGLPTAIKGAINELNDFKVTGNFVLVPLADVKAAVPSSLENITQDNIKNYLIPYGQNIGITRATGGYISGAGGPKDDKIPAMLSNGEYVINAASTKKYGGLLHDINSGNLPKFAKGGLVGAIESISGYDDPTRIVGYLGGMLSSGNNALMNTFGPSIDNLLTYELGSKVNSGRIANLFSGKAQDSVYDLLSKSLVSTLESLMLGFGLAKIPGVGPILGAITTIPDLLFKPLQGFVKFFRQTGQLDAGNNFLNGSLDFFTNTKLISDIKDRLLSGPKEAMSRFSGYLSDQYTKVAGFKDGGSVSDVKDLMGGELNSVKESYNSFGLPATFENINNPWRGQFHPAYKDSDLDLYKPTLRTAPVSSEDEYSTAVLKYGIAAHEAKHSRDWLEILSARLPLGLSNSSSNSDPSLSNIFDESRESTLLNQSLAEWVNTQGLDRETRANNYAMPLVKELDTSAYADMATISEFGYILANLGDFHNEKFPNEVGIKALETAGIFNANDFSKAATEVLNWKGPSGESFSPLKPRYKNFVETQADYSNLIGYLGANEEDPLFEAPLKSNSLLSKGFLSAVELFKSFKDNIPSVKLPAFASGGYISGEGGPRADKIPAMLSNGEFVMQASAVKKFGFANMAAINSGIKPVGFEGGTAEVTTEFPQKLTSLLTKLAQAQRDLIDAEDAVRTSEENGIGEDAALKLRDSTEKLISTLEASIASFDPKLVESEANNQGVTLGNGTGETTKKGDSFGKQVADQFANQFRTGLTEALKTGDFKTFGDMLLDSFTMSVIDSFSAGITDGLFSGLTAEGGGLSEMFSGLFNFGTETSDGVGKSITDGIATSEVNKGGFFSKIGSFFTSIMGDLGSTISGAFGGAGGGGDLLSSLLGKGSGGGLFSSLFGNSFGGFLGIPGMASGGIVPATSFSQAGKDSVPTMLTPGELVVPANKVNDVMSGNKSASQTIVNLSVTGDISRQTKSEIFKMLPTIANGVNMQNKENNYRG